MWIDKATTWRMAMKGVDATGVAGGGQTLSDLIVAKREHRLLVAQGTQLASGFALRGRDGSRPRGKLGSKEA